MRFRSDGPQEAAFRREAREWLESNLPHAYRFRTLGLEPEEMRIWYRRMCDRGWVAPHWPADFGGMGASLSIQLVLIEELARVGAPYILPMGLNLLAPALFAFGTPEQQATHLPKILSGEVFWAQGYSEPNAGSDLASLRTRAEVVPGGFIVNGEKIWSTWGDKADWMFALVRTDQAAQPRQAGISMLLIDMKSRGITARPIRTIAGDEELASVLFEDVFVPEENLLGPLNAGWKVAHHVLGYERFNVSNPVHALIALENVRKIAATSGALDDPLFRDRLAAVELDVFALSALFHHGVEIFESGKLLGPDSSILKIAATQTIQKIGELMLDVSGEAAGSAEPLMTAGGPVDVSTFYLFIRRNSIYGGSAEIQRNVLAKRVLGLSEA